MDALANAVFALISIGLTVWGIILLIRMGVVIEFPDATPEIPHLLTVNTQQREATIVPPPPPASPQQRGSVFPYMPVTERGHMLVVGASGTLKSAFVYATAIRDTDNGTPVVWLGTHFLPYHPKVQPLDVRGRITLEGTTVDDIADICESLVVELDYRLQMLRDRRDPVAMSIVIDDYPSLAKTIAQHVERLLREGRKVGMFVTIIATDGRVGSTAIHGGLIENIGTVVLSNHVDRVTERLLGVRRIPLARFTVFFGKNNGNPIRVDDLPVASHVNSPVVAPSEGVFYHRQQPDPTPQPAEAVLSARHLQLYTLLRSDAPPKDVRAATLALYPDNKTGLGKTNQRVKRMWQTLLTLDPTLPPIPATTGRRKKQEESPDEHHNG